MAKEITKQITKQFVDVLVPVALDQTYSYRVPDEFSLEAGDIVAVPLGAREALGVVWASDVAVKPGLHNRMRDVELKRRRHAVGIGPVQRDRHQYIDHPSGHFAILGRFSPI